MGSTRQEAGRCTRVDWNPEVEWKLAWGKKRRVVLLTEKTEKPKNKAGGRNAKERQKDQNKISKAKANGNFAGDPEGEEERQEG